MLTQHREEREDLLAQTAVRLGIGELAEAEVLEHGEFRQDATALRHEADAGRRALVGAAGADLGAVEPNAAAGAVHEAENARSSVVLPTPLRPSTLTSSPRPTLRLTSRKARLWP